MPGFFHKSRKFIEPLFGFIGIAMILIETYAVFARNLFKTTASWSDETLKLLFVWSIFICSALAFLSDDLIGLDLLEEKLSENKKAFTILKTIQYLFAFALSAFLSAQGVSMIMTQFATGEVTPVVQYPLWLINVGFLIGSVLTLVFSVYKIYHVIKDLKRSA